MENKVVMHNRPTIWSISGWLFAALLLTVGVLNMFLVHIVPGIAYVLISLVYIPPVNNMLRNRFGFGIPLLVKIGLAIVLVMFTLGVSDLGDMIDKL